ncbi:LD-carboxypeptidase [Pseudoalteromonas sp. SG41-1]|uniref:LD-carboxypeptidase n=1 Tax=Pseudoalteromonas neustonica TaxID=1840331 RepID=A0ABY3F852_9GAMM|nr:LD-carboxypeptidase [Pseudoalteromonas sp. SR41-4]MBB1507575.1 LD-carboxypeptidase [Pseudoalteromonas sp. SG41-1]TVU80217.1 LD-carboxypeptidase [Pseudoalteromonas neustonica]
MIPNKLKVNDEVRIIAPSRSLSIIDKKTREIANTRFEELGLKLSFSKNCESIDDFSSSSIEERIEDLHEAFLDKKVKAIFTVIGGDNVNQLLKYIDYNIVKRNPKIICGYSDTTALSNALFHKTGLVTYSGPAYSTLGMLKGIDFSINYIKKCLFSSDPYEVINSEQWSDDAWYLDQEKRNFYKDNGIEVLNHGEAEGKIVGGNLCTLNLLQGTEFMPDLTNAVLFLEDDELTSPSNFDRDLQSLIHQKNFDSVKGIVIGKFQLKSEVSETLLKKIIQSKQELASIPVLYNLNFGHTTPHICFPIGGFVKIDTKSRKQIIIEKH